MILPILKILVLPPFSLVALGLAGLFLWKRRPRAARGLVTASLLLSLVASLPATGTLLLLGLQADPPSGELDPRDAQAIVVLGAEANSFAPEFGGRTVGALSLERVRYAARLARRTGLPLVVCGGPPREGEPPLADTLAATLEQDFGLSVRWREGRSGNTRENAVEAAKILRAAGLERVLVVTHAWHLARALPEFAAAGLDARGAGTGWREPRFSEFGAWVPSARGLRETAWGLHEWLGRLWYALT